MPKQYDQAFKLLTEDDPRATLALFAGIPLSADLVVEPLDRELNLTTLQVDNLYRCRDEQSEFLIHIEAVTRYKGAAAERQFDYVQAIVAKYKLPCRSYLVILTGRGVPKKIPRTIYRKYGDHSATLRLRVVRLWRISAVSILRLNNPKLLPWIPLLNSSRANLREAFQRLDLVGESTLKARLLLLGGLRYGNREAFLERLNEMIITQEILEESSTYQYLVNIGRERGLSEGRARALRETLTKQLAHRFGPLPPAAKAKLKSASPEKLDSWIEQVLDAPTLKDALK